ncbi:23 kDa integral membrane protein-like isoform X2 [Malaya genurostris]|uniref:23 kDa integral membrane protein-like isoform X2 n=1 Tax=Malaya genurostris TaxID=325434 RepID=UPI0026F38F79|nr:23 kDa integral membrane protein-like isoform X2 [Malaya genurostris]
MGLNCGLSTIKYVLFVFNLLCSLCGIALVVVGGVSLAKISELQDITDEHNIVAPSIIFIVLGSIVFIISFFGCCGAIRESYCMTTTYGFFLMVLIIGQIVIAALVFIYVGDVRQALLKGFSRVFQQTDNAANKELVDTIQTNLQCCGDSSFLDWGVNIPQSCCSSGTAPFCIPHPVGCQKRLGEFIDSAGNVLGWVSLGVAAIELIGLIAACCLANGIRNRERRYA